MTGTDSRSAFFTREAGEYLASLAALLGGEGPPPGDEFVRLARALRGAAMLAGPPAYTRAAGQLEQAAKATREQALVWPEARGPLREALTTLQGLLGQVGAWGAEDDAAAQALAASLGTLQAPPAEPPHPPGVGGAQQGLDDFVAAEASALADALGRAADAAASGSSTFPATLRPIRLAMRSLRGLAGLAAYAPLHDILDALDAAADELATTHGGMEPAARMLGVARDLVRRISREPVEQPAPETVEDEAEVFASLLYGALVGQPGILPIEELSHPGGPARAGSWPMADRLELAALGERLRQGAAQLRSAATPAAARLQQFVLLIAIRNAPGALGSRPAGPFLAAVAKAIEAGIPHGALSRLAGVLDRAGQLLAEDAAGRTAFEGASAALMADLPLPGPDEVVPIEQLLQPEAPADTVVPIGDLLVADEPEPVVPIESLLAPPEDEEVVPIEDLLAAAPISALLEPDGSVVPIETLLVAAAARVGPFAPTVDDRTPLERSLSRYSTLVRSHAPAAPLEQLVQAAPGLPPRWSPSAALEIEAELEAIPIESLVYHGQAALDRAEEVRHDLEAALRVASTELDRLEPLVRELLDLVPLALVDQP